MPSPDLPADQFDLASTASPASGWQINFDKISDQEILHYLEKANRRKGQA